MLLSMVLDALAPFVLVVVPKYIIDELTIGKRLNVALFYMFILFISGLVLNGLNSAIEGVVNCKKEKLIQQHYKGFSDKIMSMDLENIENPEIADRKQRAQNVITWNSRNVDGIKTR